MQTLQDAEKRGEIDTLKCFIFDLDRAPTSLADTKLIKVLQWRRRCLENYLIDEKIIYDLLSDQEISKQRIANRGEVQTDLKEIAISQLKEAVARDVYAAMNYENPGLRPREIIGKSYPEMADILFARLGTLQQQVGNLADFDWKTGFTSLCAAEHLRQFAEWDTDWLILCDGKRFFRDLHQRYGVRVSPIKLKKMIVERMQREQTDAWVLVEKLLSDGLRMS